MNPKMYNTLWSADLAFWGGHKTGPNRCTLTIPTHSSASGMIARIFRKRGMRHNVHSIRVLRLGGKFPMTVNEMKSFPYPSPEVIATNPKVGFYTDDHRTIRTYVILSEVTYVIQSSIWVDPNGDPEDTQSKFEGMFEKRLSRGQVFGTYPSMGPKEYMVEEFRFVEPDDDLTPIDLHEDLGIQPYDQAFEEPGSPWYYCPMQISGGVARYPSWDEVKKLGLRRQLGGEP
jgi:hypothetical protein